MTLNMINTTDELKIGSYHRRYLKNSFMLMCNKFVEDKELEYIYIYKIVVNTRHITVG